MKKVLLFIMMFLVVGCSKATFDDNNGYGGLKDNGAYETEKDLYETIYVELNLLNEQTDEYYLFFVKPGTIGTGGKPTATRDFYGPIKVEDFKAEVNLMEEFGIGYLLEEVDDNKLQIVITTREDFLIRNPLNEEIFIYFEEVGEVITNMMSTQESFTIDIVDKYPDGVLSLPWPEADFVVKLRFKEGITPRHSYGVRIRELDEKTTSGYGVLAFGSPLSNVNNYYNAVFYKENLSNYRGVIEIEGEQPNIVQYEEYPLVVAFDGDGLPIEDNFVEVTIIEGE